MTASCKFDGCNAPAPGRRGWCKSHYDELYRHGLIKARTATERFWEKVDRSGSSMDCWLWVGTRHHKTGHGKFWLNNRTMQAHRVAYELLVGPIPDGLTLDHLCRVRACVNPAHLEPVTLEENVARGLASPTKTHCVHGHEFTKENTRHAQGRRHCRACDRRRQRESKARVPMMTPDDETPTYTALHFDLWAAEMEAGS